MSQTITAVKGFNNNMQCRGFQFEIGKSYTHEGNVEACKSGFHACTFPLDVFSYYSPGESKFAIVTASGDISKEENGDSKIAARTITVEKEISLHELVAMAVKQAVDGADSSKLEVNTGDWSAASNTGYHSAASNTGDCSVASNTGNRSAASVEGKHSVAIASGYFGKAKASAGSAIVLCYRNDDYELVHIRASKVGENGIKADTWYSLNECGEFVEVGE